VSSSDFVRISIVEESTFGTTPATPSFLVLRHSTQNFVHQVPKQADPPVTGFRGVDDLIPLIRSNFPADTVRIGVSGGSSSCTRNRAVPVSIRCRILRSRRWATRSSAPGVSCTSTSQCLDGLTCVDGVCCTTACDAPCDSCNQANARGCDRRRDAP
jgi:hypothetical protein